MASLDNKKPDLTSGEAASAPGFSGHGPDVMLGVWSSWLNAASSSAREWSDNWDNFSKRWWQITPDAAADQLLASGGKQLNDVLAKDPVLRSIDQVWNANPLREIVPVDWAEIASALRTVWLRSLRQPGQAISSAADLNARFLIAATEVWNDAGRRWWAGAGSVIPEGGPSGASDKRFAAPEWHGNPVYRTLKELYLLASDWLLRAGRSGGHGRGGAAAPQLPPAPVRRRDEPVAAAAVQPGRAAPGDGDRRRQPRRRRAQPAATT